MLIYVGIAVAFVIAGLFFFTARTKRRNQIVWPITGFISYFIPSALLYLMLPKQWWGTVVAVGAGALVSLGSWLLSVSRFSEDFERFFTHTLPWLAMVGLNSRDLSPSALMTIDDLKDPGGLAIKLREARDPLTVHLRKCLAPETRRLLGAYDGGRPSLELKQAMVNDLNVVIKGQCIFDEERFKPIELNKYIQRMLEEQKQEDDRRAPDFLLELNRLLLKKAYRHEIAGRADVFRRMSAAAIWMFICFCAAYLLSLVVLKEEFFSKTWLVQRFFGLEAPKSLWPPATSTGKDPLYWQRTFYISGKICLHYLVIMAIFIFGLSHFRVGRVNLSYVFLFALTFLIGAVTGTRSFNPLYYSSSRLTALITFARFSLWQLLSFALAAAATTGLAIFTTPAWLRGTWQKSRSWSKPRLNGEDLEVLVYAALILIASCIAEARLVVFYDRFR